MGSLAIILLAFISTVQSEPLVDTGTLRFVHVLWRHGDRSPSASTFPTDTKNPRSSWPQGWGELTDEGIRQHYALGSYLRQRYVESGFLSSNYNTSEIYVRSTSYNRTIMSALANLAGMYPAPEGRRWSENITWQPIPVHSQPKETDPLLWMDMPCPVANYTYHEDVMKSQAVRQIEAEYADFLKFVLNATGMKKMTLDDIWAVFDPLNCERLNGHEVPTWVTPSVWEQIRQLTDIASNFKYHDARLQKLRGGMLFGEIASRMQAKVRNESSVKPAGLKYYVYSAHDTTIMALLENLGVYNGHSPEYASAVIFELFETDPGNHAVKVLYVNQTGSRSPITMVMRGCGATEENPQCKLDAFDAMAREHTPSDWNAECGIVNHNSNRIEYMTIATIILGITSAILLLVVLLLVRRLKQVARPKW